jgi:starvation-inducible DNA-binding protein
MTTAVSGKRRNANEVRTFEAPASLFENLQTVLVDLIELHLQGKQAHWNVVGTNFRDVHLQLDSIADIAREASDTIADIAREASDTIAERMRALDAVPDGRSDTVVAITTVPAVPPGRLGVTETVDIITNRIYAVVWTIRAVHDEVDAYDPSTGGLAARDHIDDLEKGAWLLKSETGTV